jgi:hypothetical protein
VAKVNFVLDPAPTFKAKVEIPVHGGNAVPVEFSFIHKTKDQIDEIRGDSGPKTDLDLIFAICEGWELSDDFNDENIKKLLQNYQGAANAIYRKYLSEIMQLKLGN